MLDFALDLFGGFIPLDACTSYRHIRTVLQNVLARTFATNDTYARLAKGLRICSSAKILKHLSSIRLHVHCRRQVDEF